MDKTTQKEIIFNRMKEYCHDGIVFREKIDKITGGILLPKTMCNRDSTGRGINKRQIIGKRTVYQLNDLIKWLVDNTELINFDN